MSYITVNEMRHILAVKCKIKGMPALADELGITRQALSIIQRRKREVSDKIARHIGYERVVVYRKIED